MESSEALQENGAESSFKENKEVRNLLNQFNVQLLNRERGWGGSVWRGADFFQAGLGSYSLGNIGSDLVNFANACKTECKFPHSKVQFSGDIFPLPDSYEKLKSLLSHVSPQALAWTQAMTVGLNSYCGVSDPGEGAVSSAGMLALQSLSKHAEQIAEWSESLKM